MTTTDDEHTEAVHLGLLRERLNSDPDRLIDWFDDFDGPNRFDWLSNFFEAPICYSGVWFDTTEAAFQWAKVSASAPDWAEQRARIEHAGSPGRAKSLGQTCTLRPDWEEVKLEVMREVLALKFAPYSALAARLVATGRAYLQEGTYWNDRCWGVDLYSADQWWRRKGTNWLGMLLMERRAYLAAGGR